MDNATTQTNQDFEIVRGIPLPAKKASLSKYPFPSMGVGDSFFVAGSSVERNRLTTAVWKHSRLYGTKFCLRAARKGQSYPNGYVEQQEGYRVWRVE